MQRVTSSLNHFAANIRKSQTNVLQMNPMVSVEWELQLPNSKWDPYTPDFTFPTCTKLRQCFVKSNFFRCKKSKHLYGRTT